MALESQLLNPTPQPLGEGRPKVRGSNCPPEQTSALATKQDQRSLVAAVVDQPPTTSMACAPHWKLHSD